MNAETANKVYDILVKECGASEAERFSFVTEFTSEVPTNEWRFCGNLGFGGKFWIRGYVTCYQEDKTPERLAMIEKANEQLKVILKGE